MNLEIEIKEGDVLEINSKTWFVEEVDQLNQVTLTPQVGDKQIVERERLQEWVDFSGEVRVIKKGFLSTVDL